MNHLKTLLIIAIVLLVNGAVFLFLNSPFELPGFMAISYASFGAGLALLIAGFVRQRK